MLKDAIFDGSEYGFKFDWFGGKLHPLFKTGAIRGFFVGDKNHPYYRYWRFRKEAIDDEEGFLSWLRSICAEISYDYVKAKAEFSKLLVGIQLQPGVFAHGVTQTIYPISDSKCVVIASSYHGAAASILRAMKGRWLTKNRGWYLEEASPVMVINNLQTQCGYSEDQLYVMNGAYALIGTELSQVGDGPFIKLPSDKWFEEKTGKSKSTGKEERESGVIGARIPKIAKTGIDVSLIEHLIPEGLLPHQIEGINFLVTRTGALLADEMGTGKTRTSIVAAQIVRRSFFDAPVLITVPKSVAYKWAREIRKVYPDENAVVFDEGHVIPDASWVIVNYERMNRIKDEDAKRFCCLLVDEAHKLKELHTLRTQYAQNAAIHIPIKYLLSATPILNRETEIYSLLRLSGHQLGSIPIKEFVDRFTGSKEFRSDLNRLISGEWMIRRLQRIVLRGLIPGKQHYITKHKLSDAQLKAYNDMFLKPGAGFFEKLNPIRRLLEVSKIKIAKAYLKTIPKEEKMIVFTQYVESAHQYATELSSKRGGKFVVLTGETQSEKERDAIIRALQEDDSVKGVVGTYGVMSEGIDLWRANHVFVGSMHFVPSIQDQAEDRANRLGQVRKVNIVVPLYENTIDIDINEMSNIKSQLTQEVLDPAEEEKEAKKQLAKIMTKKLNTVVAE